MSLWPADLQALRAEGVRGSELGQRMQSVEDQLATRFGVTPDAQHVPTPIRKVAFLLLARCDAENAEQLAKLDAAIAEQLTALQQALN